MATEKWLIDAKPLMQNGWHLVKTGESNRFLGSMSLADIPTVDAVEVVHGRWNQDGVYNVCSACNGLTLMPHLKGLPRFKYCPNCGAKMVGERKTDEAD